MPGGRRGQLEAVERQTGAGKTRAFVGAVRFNDDGALVECVVKLSCNLNAHPLECIAEWVASEIGERLGLRVAGHAAVDFDPEGMAAASARLLPEVAVDIRRSQSPAYGSVFFEGRQLARGQRVAAAQVLEAASVVAFDAFIHNPDRRADNHNLLVRREALLLFDHETAFSFALPLIGAADPVTDPLIAVVEHHALYLPIAGRLSEQLTEFRQRLAALTDEVLRAIANTVPSEWLIGNGASNLARIMEVLAARRDAVDSWLPQVEACLSRT